MASVDEIGQEKQRISERLARLDAERTSTKIPKYQYVALNCPF